MFRAQTFLLFGKVKINFFVHFSLRVWSSGYLCSLDALANSLSVSPSHSLLGKQTNRSRPGSDGSSQNSMHRMHHHIHYALMGLHHKRHTLDHTHHYQGAAFGSPHLLHSTYHSLPMRRRFHCLQGSRGIVHYPAVWNYASWPMGCQSVFIRALTAHTPILKIRPFPFPFPPPSPSILLSLTSLAGEAALCSI